NIVDDTRYSMDTHLIYGKNITKKWDYEHHVLPPISSSVIYRMDSVERGAEGFQEFAHSPETGEEPMPIYIYDRLGDPNKEILEENLAYLERGEISVTFSTGMGAISGILGVLTRTGDEIVAHKTLYGCTYSLMMNWLPRYDIKTRFADFTNTEEVINSITDKTKVLYLESPANPNLDIIDIKEIRKIVDDLNKNRDNISKIKIVVDNTFATPYCQRPIELGADFSVNSLTKGLGGFGTDMGGAVIGRMSYKDLLLLYRKDFGAVLNNKSAWNVLTYGLTTLPIRIKQQMKSAMRIAEYLESHPKIEYVKYPGLPSHPGYEIAKRQMIDFNGNFAPGTLIYFVLKGKTPAESKENGRKFINYVASHAYTMTLAVSLGHTRTLIEHPASMTHSMIPAEKLVESGIDPGGVRYAIGIEDVNDILMDLDECLKVV
ncbi:MAG: aminotransferase class I/II-fold pyridoxal phosphate-dependent enzyme, partial [Ignavibacteriales bacterium]